MPTTRIDMEISRSKEAYQLREEYEKKFGEKPPVFNNDDFRATRELHAAEVFLQALRKAIDENKPIKVEPLGDDWT